MSAAAVSLLEQINAAKDVELAYRAQAAGIVRRYNAEANRDPYSPLAESLFKLRKEALSQWKAAREQKAALLLRWSCLNRSAQAYARAVT